MPKFTRRRLLAGAAPIVAAPVLAKMALDGNAEAAQRTLQGHVHDHPHMGHAAMVGGNAPAPGGPNDLDDLLFPPPPLPYQPGRVREYEMRALDKEIEIAPGVFFPAWTYNGTVPGPVIRATEDDILRVRLSTPAHTRTRSTSTASTRRTWTASSRSCAPARSSSTSSPRSLPGCTSTTATPRR